MRFFSAIAIVLLVAATGCKDDRLCKYHIEEYRGSLLYEIADKHGVCIENVGTALMVAGAANEVVKQVKYQEIIRVYNEAKVLLLQRPTGHEFVGRIERAAKRYGGLLDITLRYMESFDVQKRLDDQTVAVLVNWCDDRIEYYELLLTVPT